MKYCSDLKKGNPVIYGNTNKLEGHYVKRNKPVTEGKIMHDSTYIRYLKY